MNNTSFKVGDKVRLTNHKDNESISYIFHKVNNIVTISKIYDGNMLDFKEINAPGWYATRFEKVENMTKLDLHKPVQTRDGRPVRLICTNKKGDFPLVGLVLKNNGDEEVITFSNNGLYYENGPECISDLVNVPERKERWLNVYPPDTCVAPFEKSRYDADVRASSHRIGVLHLVYEDNKVVSTEYIEV